MARRRGGKSGSGTAIGVGLALAATVAVGLAVARSKAAQAAPQMPPAPPSPAPPATPVSQGGVTPPGLASTTLQAGHRYQIQQLAPLPGGGPVATVPQAQAFFDAIFPGAVKIVSITPASGSQPTTILFDVASNLPFTAPTTMPVTDLGKSPPAPPAGTSFTALITDPNAVKQYQTLMADAFTNNPGTPSLLGLAPADFTAADVNGNPNDPRWTRVVSAYQTFMNTQLPSVVASGKAPAGFPSQLRTDGLLDYATAVAINNG